MGFALILALSVASLSYVLSVRYLKENQQQSALTNIHVLGNDLDSDISSVLTFANWICLDSTLENYLRTVNRTYAQDAHLGKKLSLSAWNHLNNEFNIIGVRNHIGRVLISTPDGKQFLQVVGVERHTAHHQVEAQRILFSHGIAYIFYCQSGIGSDSQCGRRAMLREGNCQIKCMSGRVIDNDIDHV